MEVLLFLLWDPFGKRATRLPHGQLTLQPFSSEILGAVVRLQRAVPLGQPQHRHGKADYLSSTGKAASNPRQ